MAISLKTHKILWAKSGNCCAMPDCRKQLVEDATETDDASVVGDEAHIVAREEEGPRGKSALSIDERDRFDNLILLCKIHHKLIDDQPKKYTVEALHQLKSEHLVWVAKNLNSDIDKQKDDEVYATYIDNWVEFANINNWQSWTSFIFGGGQPQISVEQFEKLIELNKYILSRVWPKRYDKIEFAFSNFRVILTDFINVFEKYSERVGRDEEPWYNTEKFYHHLKEWNPQKYSELLSEFEFHTDLVQDLACELTRAANYLCDQIRKYFSVSFRINEGVLLIETGPDMNFSWTTIRLEFNQVDQDSVRYPGIEKFMEIREGRGYHFGKGVNKNYFKTRF